MDATGGHGLQAQGKGLMVKEGWQGARVRQNVRPIHALTDQYMDQQTVFSLKRETQYRFVLHVALQLKMYSVMQAKFGNILQIQTKSQLCILADTIAFQNNQKYQNNTSKMK
jgi:hypothetical protein